MPQSVRQLLMAALLAWHGAATLAGPSLHVLPGLGHSESGHNESGDGQDCPTPSLAKAAEGCSICQHQTQGQAVPVRLLPTGRLDAEAAWRPPARPASIPVAGYSPAAPRAPPAL